jgi:isocitrate dehydrogenase
MSAMNQTSTSAASEFTTITPIPVTLIPGDGIGPEVTAAARRVLEAAHAPIEWHEHTAGREVFLGGDATGVPRATIDSIASTRVALKGPLETPIGFGGKSANVTLRKLFETYGNTRPARTIPGIRTPFSDRNIDMVVVRENVEDLYAGIEHMQTPSVAQCLKLISRKGCEKISRLAFEVARSEGRKKVTCVTKANIMKLTEGMLKRVFEEVAADYPDIETEYMLVDNCAHQLVRVPESFDVLVTTNMNGDVLSDLVSGLVGGLGIAPGANLGNHAAIFEAVHGTAPDIAGKDLANPTATLLSAVMMLRHLGLFEIADRVEAAVALTLERGPRTGDICGDLEPCGTSAFTDAVIGNLGSAPDGWEGRSYRPLLLPEVSADPVAATPTSRRTMGIDVFCESGLSPEELGKSLERLTEGTALKLKIISNRGTVVYPLTGAPTDCIDHWRCRFLARAEGADLTDAECLELVAQVATEHRFMQIEKLYEFDGERAYTLAQGEA